MAVTNGVRTLFRLLTLAVTGLALSCGGSEPAGPSTPATPSAIPGVLVIVLEGAIADEDAAVLIDVGSGADTFNAGRTELELHSRTVAGSSIVAVFGPLAGGTILEIGIPDVAAIPTLALREVAMLDGELRSNLSTYRLQISEIR